MPRPLAELWRNPWVRLAALAAALVLVAWLLSALSDILFPLLLALIFAYIFDPIIDWFEAHKMSRAVGIVSLLGVVGVLLVGVPVYVVPSMVAEVGDLTDAVRENLPAWQTRVEAYAEAHRDAALVQAAQARADDVLEWLRARVPDLLVSARDVILGAASGALGFVGLVTNFVLFSIVAIYLLHDFDPLMAQLRELVPHPYRARTFAVAGRINENVRNFFRGQITVCAILTAIYTTGLLIFDVPFAPLLGFIGGFGQLIPYVGTLLGAVPAVLLALLEHHALVPVVGAAGTFAVGQLAEGMLITPKIVGDKVGLHPVVVILALMIFTKAFGFIGLLLAVPLAAALKVLLAEALVEYRASALYLGPAGGPAVAVPPSEGAASQASAPAVPPPEP